VNTDGFKPNLETHLVPLLATKHEDTPTNSDEKSSNSTKVTHHPLLLQVTPISHLCFWDSPHDCTKI
jgi:aspartyl aminopeptidase